MHPAHSGSVHSYLHRGGEQPLQGLTLDQGFQRSVRSFGEREAAVFLHQGHRLSYRQLDERVQEVARGLVGLGLQPGERVGIWSTDHLEWLLIQLACARLGLVLVNVNPAYRSEELAFALERVHVHALFLIPAFRSSDYLDMLAQVRDRLPRLRHVIVFDPFQSSPDWERFLEGQGSDAEVGGFARGVDFDAPVNVQFTSGTTGFPKPVLLTHHNLFNNAWFCGEALHFTELDRLCVPVPFYHCFGMVVSNLLTLLRGAALVVPAEHFDARATLQAIQDERCTAVHGVPTMFIQLLEQAPVDTSSLRTGIMAGAPCPPSVMERVIGELGCREILIAYGQTEASPVTHITAVEDSFERRVHTVGTNLPHQECKIVDTETGAVLPRGQQGEVCFRGHQVMRGYDGDAEATSKAIDPQGWLHSGDLGVMDEEGYLRITGRLRDMVIRGGENIYPAEIEAILLRHPEVLQVAVFGLPDEHWGETVAAFVRVRESADGLRDWAREHMAHFKVPEHVWVVDEFPMTVTGKVQKFRMRELALGWLAEDGGGG
jgi:fatty-acyl-CoA synthase